MQQPLPKSVTDFKEKYPAIWEAFATLGDRCHQAGPLDEKTRRLVKLGIAIAHRHEGAVHSAVRNALKSGVTVEEMFHAAILAVTTIGWPTAYAAMTWIDDAVGGSGDQPILAD
jgi:alkylhydroperoxidase/carboxymuconolactone decarboxylase family protein YurZ